MLVRSDLFKKLIMIPSIVHPDVEHQGLSEKRKEFFHGWSVYDLPLLFFRLEICSDADLFSVFSDEGMCVNQPESI